VNKRLLFTASSGFTLAEVLVSIVVLGIAAAAILGMFTSAIKTSADPMIQQQAIAIAEAYMTEILRKDFADDMENNTDSGGSEGSENRPDYNDIQDYNSLPDQIVRDQNDTAIAALSDFRVAVTVLPDLFKGISSQCAKRIDVTVTHDRFQNVNIQLSSFRTYYYEVGNDIQTCP